MLVGMPPEGNPGDGHGEPPQRMLPERADGVPSTTEKGETDDSQQTSNTEQGTLPEMPEDASGQINYESEQGAKELAYESENYVFSEQYTQFSTTRLRSEMEVVPIPLPYSTWSFDDPYFGMQTAMTRIDIEWPMDGEDPIRQKEDAKLSLEKLLKGYTINAAKQLRVDDVVGSIEAGKSANYNVYDVNLFDVPEDEFQYVLPTLVVFEGRVLFGN